MHYLALTFKHAVEFSSFGCTPRICLSDSCLGQLDSLYSSLSPESNPVSDLFFAAVEVLIAFTISPSATRLTLFRSSVGVKSDFPIPAAFLCRFTFVDPAPRQPALPYQDLDPSQATRSRSWPRPHRVVPRSCRRVPERAGPRVTWLWWVSSRVGRCSECPPCRVPHPSRLRKHYACGLRESSRPVVTALTPSRHGLDRPYERSSDTAPTVRLPRRVIT